ncbi:DUF5694 domain-containing protein [Sporosarcina sp. ACRSL]|uniref:DUF5694 domain-containing protein n=1 Tax=Sporosarcina sp. ACRSL TaxID=2918215 RepID=UPI001EF5EAC2|nr:DUF5694 domain-containing protein [Sporosarcina sp. ACRSL]MCG7345864.1 DUF5694 domain-containing protein [Sporosarcina sp. ACRSL]
MPSNKTSKPKIMVMGTFHMGSTSDMIEIEKDSMLSPQRQKEIEEVVDRLKDFKPTKIALEVEKKKNDLINEEFTGFLKGDYQLQENEIDQIGYRLAKEMGHQEVYAVDWMEQGACQREINEVVEWTKEHQPELYEEIFCPFYQLELTAAGKSVKDLLLYHNQPEVVDQTHRSYVNMARIKDAVQYVGMDWLIWWYQRNLILFSNLSDLATAPEDRILFIVGGSHVRILENFVKESGLFECVSVQSYLQ